jgi:hypothetical protein
MGRKRLSKEERLLRASYRIRKAIADINRSKMAIEFSKELRSLNEIEDKLWQYATALKGE